MLNKSGIIYQDINHIRTASYRHELLIIHCRYKKLPKNQSDKARKGIEIAFKLIEAEITTGAQTYMSRFSYNPILHCKDSCMQTSNHLKLTNGS